MTILIRPTDTGAHRIILQVGSVYFQSQRLYSALESKKIVQELEKTIKFKKGAKK